MMHSHDVYNIRCYPRQVRRSTGQMKGVLAEITEEELQARFHLAIKDCASVVSRLGVSPELENRIQAGDARSAWPPFSWPADRPAALCASCYCATSIHFTPYAETQKAS